MTTRRATELRVDPEPRQTSAAVNPDDVARRAYEIYEARGAAPGADLDDWLHAERELRAARERNPNEAV